MQNLKRKTQIHNVIVQNYPDLVGTKLKALSFKLGPSVLHLTLFVFLGCRQSPLLYRIGRDYFPLKEGNLWIYLNKETQDTIKLKVVKRTTLDRECWLLTRDGEQEFWYKDEHNLEKLYKYNIFFGGEEYEICKFWLPWLKLPLVLNNQWEKKFNAQKVILNDTIKVKVEIKAKVSELKDNVYRVDISVIEKKEGLITSYKKTTYSEHYKPEIGITKRIVNEITEELIEAHITKD